MKIKKRPCCMIFRNFSHFCVHVTAFIYILFFLQSVFIKIFPLRDCHTKLLSSVQYLFYFLRLKHALREFLVTNHSNYFIWTVLYIITVNI